MTEPVPEAIELPIQAWATEEISFSDARQRFQSTVFAFVARRVRPTEEAEDIVASVFVDAFKSWRRRRGDARLWLLGIARRKVADTLRRKRQAWTLRDEDLRADAMSSFVTHAEAFQAAAIVARLPEDERDALLMQVLEEMSIEEIAGVLGRSPKAVNSLLGRARTRVRRLAEKHAPPTGEGSRR